MDNLTRFLPQTSEKQIALGPWYTARDIPTRNKIIGSDCLWHYTMKIKLYPREQPGF